MRVARALGELKFVDAAFAAGKLSYSKVRAITRSATPETEQDFLDISSNATASQIERLSSAYRRIRVDPMAPPLDQRRIVRRSDTVSGIGYVCTPGETVTLSCAASAGAPAQVMRVCETSAVLGHGIHCMYRDALASATVGEMPIDVSFTSPEPRDADEPGGAYSTYAAPAIATDMAATITCM